MVPVDLCEHEWSDSDSLAAPNSTRFRYWLLLPLPAVLTWRLFTRGAHTHARIDGSNTDRHGFPTVMMPSPALCCSCGAALPALLLLERKVQVGILESEWYIWWWLVDASRNWREIKVKMYFGAASNYVTIYQCTSVWFNLRRVHPSTYCFWTEFGQIITLSV
jgi:hypothetical protein